MRGERGGKVDEGHSGKGDAESGAEVIVSPASYVLFFGVDL